MYAHPATRWPQFVTLLGGIIAFSCFFMPWLTSRISETYRYTRLGIQFFLPNPIGPAAIYILAVFIASIVIVSLSLYTIIRRKPLKIKGPVLISSGIGIAVLLGEQLRYTRITETVAHSNYATEFGFWGTIVGLVVATIGILLIRREDGSEQPKVSVETKRFWFVVHGGGIISLLCFFMPWKGIVPTIGRSGFESMNLDFVIAIAFATSIITVVSSFYTLASEDFTRLKGVAFVSIGIGLGILLLYCLNFYTEDYFRKSMFRRISTTERYKESFRFGLWGTILGYIIAAVGMFLIHRKGTNKQVEGPAA